MRLFALATLALLLFTSAANAHSPSACERPEPSDAPLTFVGKPSALIDGQGGFLLWLELCRAEFPGSRVCTTRDLIENGNLPALEDNEFIWVLPFWLDSVHDYSGAKIDNGSCVVLANNPNLPAPRIAQIGCTETRGLACCE